MCYLRRCWLSALFALSVVMLAVSSASAPSALAAVRPSLRLFGSARRLTVTQNDLRYGTADLGLWIAAVGGDFQIDLKRPGYGAWTAFQVNSATATALRSIPASLVDPIRGFKRFLSVRFVDARGRTAAHREVTFCPNSQAARVDDSGPFNPTYLSFCQDFSGFPFVRGEVWGINQRLGGHTSPCLRVVARLGDRRSPARPASSGCVSALAQWLGFAEARPVHSDREDHRSVPKAFRDCGWTGDSTGGLAGAVLRAAAGPSALAPTPEPQA